MTEKPEYETNVLKRRQEPLINPAKVHFGPYIPKVGICLKMAATSDDRKDSELPAANMAVRENLAPVPVPN